MINFLSSPKFLFTSESVSEGHPDKVCDQISDSVVDAILSQDPYGRVACETVATTGLILVTGEITTSCYVDIPVLVRQTVADIGYFSADYGFDCNTCGVITSIKEQSADIALGVDKAQEAKNGAMQDNVEQIGAGDQGMMFGYACTETPELMPMPIMLAHGLVKRLAALRKDGTLPYLRPDGKSQVTVEYSHGKPVRVDTIVVATQHAPDVSQERIRADVIEHVVRAVVPAHMLDKNTKYYVNSTGRFVIGGPMGDSGLTGRKIIVDTYGGMVPHGGGAFSG
ncbi:MAG: methionine adenosyltransferase, partial [Chloroflexota bacterium]